MRRPVIARKATTQITRNKAGIIGQQVYLSCARCNAKPAGLPLLAGVSASACQSGFATDGGVAMNNSALGCFIYRRNERVDIVRRRVRFGWALTQSPDTTQNTAIAKSSALGLARTFGSGFSVGHAIKKLRAGASWMRSCLSTARAHSGARVPQPGGRIGFLCRRDRRLGRKRRYACFLRTWL
jgi:hypothetical protein